MDVSYWNAELAFAPGSLPELSEHRRKTTTVGHPALVDKIFQEAVVNVLNEIYEADAL
jgi:hypothetical protein